MKVEIELYKPDDVIPEAMEAVMFFAGGAWHEGHRTIQHSYLSEYTGEEFESNEVWFWHVSLDADALMEMIE